ncbi:MAG: tetratricopeptide repeat protein, partial [Bacillota bacterium]
VETAVEAMKLGAVDYLRKPFKPDEIKELVEEVFKRYEIDSEEYEAESFSEFVNMAKGEINKHNYDRAVELLKKATSIDPEKPEPFNLLGIIYEMRNNQPEAMKMYRTALSLDPTYTPANENLDRAGDMASSKNLNEMNMGDEDK